MCTVRLVVGRQHVVSVGATLRMDEAALSAYARNAPFNFFPLFFVLKQTKGLNSDASCSAMVVALCFLNKWNYSFHKILLAEVDPNRYLSRFVIGSRSSAGTKSLIQVNLSFKVAAALTPFPMSSSLPFSKESYYQSMSSTCLTGSRDPPRTSYLWNRYLESGNVPSTVT
jgi:hypothetical protein